MATQVSGDTHAGHNSAGYQVLLTALLSLNFGIVLFDRNAISFLMPFIQPELGLNNTQVGMLAGALSLTWAVAALGVGVVVDRFGARKRLLLLATLAFSLCSFLSGIAASFAMLLGARLLMGLAEGGIMPISQSMIATEVSHRHRGAAMGFAQGFGSSLMGSFVAPVVLVAFAAAYGWRNSFFLAGAPGLLCALLMFLLIRAPREATKPGVREARAPMRAVLADRNVVLCVVIGILLVSYLVVTWAFMPLYLTQVRNYDAQTMGWLMGALGISATLASFGIPALSDYVGRRVLTIVLALVGLILPLAALYYTGSTWGLAALFFIGWTVTGTFPLFMATIPSESVAPAHVASALGLCMGISEILGGVLSPLIAGYAADRSGLQAPLWMLFGFALVSGILALGLRETAPSVLARRTARA
jgi:ACS family hexuronate transporter-like MFS transporter